jgi:hypothetical protein
MSQIIELQPGQVRQYINAETVYHELARTMSESRDVRGSMFWREQSGGEYLIKESVVGSQKSLGVRSDATQQIFEKFKERKAQVSDRLAKLISASNDQQRLNKAMRVGRVPSVVVKTLAAIARAGLQDHFVTIGTHALYAYESAAGVRFMPDMLATSDIDLLFDSRKRIAFAAQMQRGAGKDGMKSFIGILQKADPSFRVMQDQKQTAVNDAGFEVDVIRRIARGDDPHPFRMSDDEEDMWAVQVAGADKMLSTPRFSQMVVSETGHMAMMNTLDPLTFIAIKRMIAALPSRDPRRRNKDALQADVVEELVRTRMPQLFEKHVSTDDGSCRPKAD